MPSRRWRTSYHGTQDVLRRTLTSFSATATAGGYTGPASQPFLVTVDKTAPAVAVAAASGASKGPVVTVTAGDLNGLPNGTAVTVDVDTNNDGNFTDPGETGYTSGTLTGGG